MKKAIYKVPNGKLLKIFLEEAGGKIHSIQISGDFFAHPEENIEALEQRLKGAPLVRDALRTTVEQFLAETSTSLFGVDAESIASTIVSAS